MKIFARCAWCNKTNESKEDWKHCPHCGREYLRYAMPLKDFAEKAKEAARYEAKCGLVVALSALILFFAALGFLISFEGIFMVIFLVYVFAILFFLVFGMNPLFDYLIKKKFPILYKHPFFSIELFK